MSGLISRLKRKGVITDDDELEKDKKKVNLRETENSLPTASDFRDDLESAGSSNDRKKKSYFGKGNIDLNNRKVLKNRDGSISTEQSISFGDDDGNEILVPTIINGKKVSNREAIKHYYKTGENLGIFKSVEEADKYAQKLHNRQNRYYNSTQKTTREDDSDNWFQEKNKDKKLRRVSSENVLPTKNDLIRSVAKTAIEDGKNSDSFLTRAVANLAGVGVDAGLTLRNTIENTIEAAPSSWQWANRKAKEIEKGSSNSKVQEFLMRNYELNNYLNQGSNQYDNINKEKQKALDDLVNHGTGLANLKEEDKNTLKSEIMQIMNKHENISMNNSDANTRGEQLDEITKTIEKYMGLNYYDNVVDKTQNVVNTIEEEKQKNVDYATSDLGKKSVEVLGNGLGSVATSAIPIVGQAGLFASSSQQYYNEAKQRGMDDEKASAFGDIMGLVEAGTEGINISNIKNVWKSFKTLGKSETKKIIETAAKQGAKQETLSMLTSLEGNSLKDVIKNLAISSGENYAQEFATEYIQEGVATAIDNKGQWNGILKRANESGIAGALTALIPGMAGIVNIGNGSTQINNFVKDLSNNNITKEQLDLISNELAKTSNSSKEDIKETLTAVAEAYQEIQPQKNITNTQGIEQLPVANEQNTNSNKLRKIAENEINNSNISNKDKQEMLETLNSTEQITEADMKAIRNTINETATAKVVRDTLSRNGTFQEQVDKYISGDLPSGDFLYLGDTPQILQKIGLPNNEVILKQSKLKSLMQESNDNTDKFHGIPAETIKRIPEAIGNPLNVLKSSTDENSIIIITDLADTSERPIIASIEVNYDGQIGKIDFLSNRLTSAYGKNNYDRFMQTEIEKGNMLYDIDEGIIKELPTTRLQSPKGISSFVDANNNASTSNNSIPQSTENVKSDSTITNNSMQNTENNTQNNILKSEDIITKNKEENLSQKETEEKVAEILKKPQKRVEEKDRTWAIFKAGILDKGIVFEELSHKTKNRELQGKWDYTLTATARGQNAIGNARYEYDSKNKTRKQISKSLEDIRAEVGKNTKDFYKYMYHQLNIDRMTLEERYGTDNKPVFSNETTAEISQKIVDELEEKYPKFKEYAQDIYDYNNANKQELVKNGVISQELADKLAEMYPHYVPIKRVDTKGNAIKVPLDTNRTGVNAPLARATGGTSDIQPLFETMADRTMQTYRASARNNFGLELMNTLNSQTESVTTDIDTIIDEIGSEDTELLKEGKNGENPTFTVFNNGEKTTFEITKDMYDALKPLSDSSLLKRTWFKGVPNKISNLRRGVLTEYNPLFSITNAIKDAQDVIVNSQHTAKTFSKFPEAYSQILQKGYWYNEYMEHGGEQNSYFRDGEFESDKKISTAKRALQIPLDAISSVNNVIEMAPRLAEYIASRESGRSIETSMLDAARVTTNFKAGGDITKALNRNGATFLNASVQGFQQQIRNIKEANMQGLKGYALLVGRYAVAGVVPAIINSLVWKDDKDYDDLQDYVKDNYYCVAKLGDGKFVRLPKGRVAATLQKIVSNISEYMTEDKKLNLDSFAKDFWEDIQFTMDNVAPNNPLDNNVLSPIIQAMKNTTWYGEDLVPQRLQDKPKEEQYDETTDSLSKWIGENLKVSPYKVNYLLDQYLGGVGDIILPKLTKQAENNVLEDKFTTDSVMKSRYPGEFFVKSDELKINNNSSKATDEDTLKYKYISGISSDMSNLYKQKREIQNSNATDKVKKQQLKEVQKQINSMAKEALENVDKVTINKNSATIGTQQYYKDTKGRWKKVTDEDKIEGVSLNTYTDYKTKLEETKQKKIDSGELKENQQLSDSEKIKILLSSNYSQKEKAAIYEKSILSSQDETYPALKKLFTNKGLNINNYLEYKSQKFEANKKDDGTVKGKSVSGTKKKKVYNYVNKMNISYTQKLVLLGTQYKLSNTERARLANFVNNSDLSYDEKMTLYGKFKGFKVYKNGTITY